MSRLSNHPNFFNAAKQACVDLKAHTRGELELTPKERTARIALVQLASRESFYFFAKAVLGFDKLTSQTHKRWCEDLQAKWKKHHYLLRLKPRGTYKTTIYAEAFMLWVWAQYPDFRWVYTSANQQLLDEVSAHLDHILAFDSDSLFATVFGIRRDRTAQKNTNDVFNITGRNPNAKGMSLTFRPAGGSTNGLHPHGIIVDDPCDQDDRDSPAVRTQKARWFDSLLPLLVPYETPEGPIKILALIGTRWHLQDVFQHAMDTNARATSEDDKFDIEIESVLAPDGSAAYPEFFPLARVNELKGKMSDVFFSCQYLNAPLPEGSRIFEESRLFFLRTEQVNLREGSNICVFDPSQGKTGGDFPAPWWINVLNGRKFFFHALDQKIQITAMVPLIAALNKQNLVREMVFENNGTMDLLEEKIYEAHQALGYPIMITKIHETRNKVERITAMQPELYNGSTFFRADWRDAYPEAMNQIIFFPAWGHDDFPDSAEKGLTHIARNMPGSFAQGAGETVRKNGTLAGSLRSSTHSSRSVSW